jgi:FG-GAP repeat protein
MRRTTLPLFLGALFSLRAELVAQQLIGELDSGNRTATGDEFASSCASISDLDGDGVPDLVVGAPLARISTTRNGRVYVFSGATRALLYSHDGSQNDERFGYHVAGGWDIDGDGAGDFLVASPTFDTSAGVDRGRVLVYSGRSGALIRSHDGQRGSQFGYSLAMISDLDGDGRSDYLIAAPYDGNGTVYAVSGATGTFLYSLPGWIAQQFLGDSLAAVGDVDSDGVDDFAVGSRVSTGGGGPQRGRVDVFSGATRSRIAALIGQAPDDGSLGSSLTGGADLDGDGVPDLVVGDANHYIGGTSGYGAAFIYSGASWNPIQTWLGASPTDAFGFDVAVLGDVNGDAVSDVLISNGYAKIGAVYLYSGKTRNGLYEFTSGFAGDKFGQQVASVGDLDGDGLADLEIGALADSQHFVDSGRAYLYAGSPLFLQANSTALNPGDLLDLASHCREPSVLTALAIVDVGSLPTFNVLDLGYADSLGERSLTATVPSGLSGLVLSLQAFADDSKQGVVESAVLELTFL